MYYTLHPLLISLIMIWPLFGCSLSDKSSSSQPIARLIEPCDASLFDFGTDANHFTHSLTDRESKAN
jgi:hypothetical protein